MKVEDRTLGSSLKDEAEVGESSKDLQSQGDGAENKKSGMIACRPSFQRAEPSIVWALRKDACERVGGRHQERSADQRCEVQLRTGKCSKSGE